MLRRPPTVIPSRFGPDSLTLHLREAEGAQCGDAESLSWNSFRVDVDTPEDMAEVLRWPGVGRTRRYAESIGLGERLPGPKKPRASLRS